MLLAGKRAVVTGCRRGIGKAIAVTLAQNGADVALNDVALTDADEVVAEVKRAGRRALCVPADISDPKAVQGVFAAVREGFGGLDILVNNAGITRDAMSHKMTLEQWNQVISVNLTGAFLCCQAGARLLVEGGGGKIVNLSSLVAFRGNIGQANYSASKAGVAALTKTLAKELASKKVLVNAVAPGFIDTPMTAAIPDKLKANMIAAIPLGRAGTPQDVANVVLFLVSPLSDYMTGQVLHVNGGTYMD